jgi:hypothetical protein
MRRIALGLFLMFATTGCPYYPVEQVKQVDERPGLLVQGAPYGSVLFVDGLYAGPIIGSDGAPQAIRVEPGTHEAQVVLGDRALMSQRVFVSGAGVKTLTFSGTPQ